MNILIIGNGFDLAHRLPTSYTDFLKFFHSVEKMPIFCGTNKEYEERIAKIHTNSAEIRDTLIKILNQESLIKVHLSPKKFLAIQLHKRFIKI